MAFGSTPQQQQHSPLSHRHQVQSGYPGRSTAPICIAGHDKLGPHVVGTLLLVTEMQKRLVLVLPEQTTGKTTHSHCVSGRMVRVIELAWNPKKLPCYADLTGSNSSSGMAEFACKQAYTRHLVLA